MTIDERAQARLIDIALLVLRLAVGLVLFMHGWQKMFDNGIDGVARFFGSLGIPAPGLMAIVVTFVELVGGAAIILGVLTRVFALLAAIDVFVALLVVHRPNGFFVGDNGIELVFLICGACLTLVIAGPGRFSVDAALGLAGSRPVRRVVA